MAKSNKNSELKITKALENLLLQIDKEGVNLKGLKVTSGKNIVTKEYCESIGMKLKCVKKANGDTHCYCVLPSPPSK